MRAFVNYVEGAASAFQIFPDHEVELKVLPKVRYKSTAEAFAQDTQALRRDVRKAMALLRAEE